MFAHVFSFGVGDLGGPTKPIYAQLDLLLRATIHVFMTGCLLGPLNVANCRRFFNKYKMSCPPIQKMRKEANRSEQKRKGKSTYTKQMLSIDKRPAWESACCPCCPLTLDRTLSIHKMRPYRLWLLIHFIWFAC